MTTNNFNNNIVGKLITPVNRRTFKNIVDKYKGDFACKKLTTWEQFMAILLGQLGSCNSLRGIENIIKFHSSEQYHLGIKKDISKSTLSDANRKRDWRIFKDLFLNLISNLKDNEIIETKEVIKIIDSTPIGLNEEWCEKTLRITGLKVHTIFSLNDNIPVYFDITGAKTNDLTQAKTFDIEKNCTYVFDRGYISSKWWDGINNQGAFFVSRNFKHFEYSVIKTDYKNTTDENKLTSGEVLEDSTIEANGGKFKQFYKNRLRMVVVKREKEQTNLKLFTNDFIRTKEEIAKLYKDRWQIELFFKWIKQNLKIKKFISKSENGIKIQICICMIAFVLLRLAQLIKTISSKIPLKTLITIAKCSLFTRLRIKDYTKKCQKNPNQLQFYFMKSG
jgi:putative transposase